MKKIKTEIEYYFKSAAQQIESEQAVVNEKAKANAAKDLAARKAKYGLEGKEVKSIKIVTDVPEEFGYYVPFSYYIEATLENGQKIRTKYDEGFLEDYNIEKTVTDFNGAIPHGFVPGDAVVIKASVKSNPAVKAEKKITIPYNMDAAFTYSENIAGADGHHVKIFIKEEKHGVTGEPVLRVRLKSAAFWAKDIKFSINPKNTIVVDCSGRNGRDLQNHYRGGDGGDVEIYVDPSVTTYKLRLDNSGGKGYGTSANGNSGSKNVYKEAVTF